MTIPHIPSKGRISVNKIQKFTIQRQQSLVRIVYGSLLVILSVIMITLDPVNLFTNWFLEMRNGSFVFRMWENPTYVIKAEVWVFNYTNVDDFLAGKDQVLKLEEVGPFFFKEHRTNVNMSVDDEKGVLKFHPRTTLEFIPEESVAHYKDVYITIPSIAIIAISTLLADKFGYFPNAGAYYSMKALDSRLFRNVTVEKYFWGYEDPIANLANKILPGWIDFERIGILDRFYAEKDEEVEVELRDETKKYSIIKWGGSSGLKAQGFTDLNSSIPCNRLKGSYEGLMFAPNVSKDAVLSVYRKQACRLYPFSFQKEVDTGLGFNAYRFVLKDDSFNNTSEYACKCDGNCLPNGFIDISNCYYGFPITLSKPHFGDVDERELMKFEGLHPDKEKYASVAEIEPSLGIPLTVKSQVQVNLAARTSPANPLTKPVKDRILPLIRVSMFVKEPPSDVVLPLRLRFVYAPPMMIVLEVILIIAGVYLCSTSFYRIWKPRYQLVENTSDASKKSSNFKRKSVKRNENIVINMSFNKGFSDDEEDVPRQAVSLLALKESLPDYISRDS